MPQKELSVCYLPRREKDESIRCNTKEDGGCNRVRGVFATKIKADEYVGPQDTRETIKCDGCGQQKSNPAYDELEAWKQELSIKEWYVQ